ncbi:MAG: hypothetical protein U0800_22195 [Isosphaeraceae bacterium]
MFDVATRKAAPPELVAESLTPRLAFHPTQKYLYAVNELDQFQGEKSGSISSFRDRTFREL